ncbi:hypothetical protein LINGRAHAP2_LOCUS19309 [Linum grandiflorum]
MNQVQNINKQTGESNFPGCLGRMVNLFDLANGVSGNRLLTNKPHNGSSLARSQSDVVRMMGAPFGDQIEDKMIVSEFRRCSSNKKASGTPMKTLIAQELNKEVESKQKPPNLVAKLMGLDALPHQHQQQPTCGGVQKSQTKGYSRRSLSHSGILTGCWEPDGSFSDKEIQFGDYHCPEPECMDAYEVWQQSLRDDSPQKRRPDRNMNDRKMALIRQKFMELKCLATDEKGRQSKEFQEALDILSSNRDLLLKFFQEPNSMFSQHLYDMLSIPPPPETKRITVLRPSTKVADSDKSKSAGLAKKGGDKKATKPGCAPTFPSDEYSPQPTRIVVLKPSPARTFDIKAVVSPPSSTPRAGQGEEFCDEADDHEAQESKEVGRDEPFLSSVFSNGYICDDSSFNKSEAESENGNLSDSEIASPASRHSWDFINRFDSPFSSASFSRASFSPESSVCREAKKRLSERWAMMASNMNSQEQNNTNARKSSSTLGEMLALSDGKKPVVSEERPKNKEPELEASTSYLVSNQNTEEGIEESARSLVRSKSLPVSSSIYGDRLNVEISESVAVKSQVPKELTKAKSMKSSLRGKVSGLFFSKSKKSKDKNSASVSQADCQSVPSEVSLVPNPGRTSDDGSSRISKNGMEECCSSSLDASHEGALTVAKPEMERNASGENPDQPSPISVLEAPFEEDDINITELCASIKLDRRGSELLSKSNLIDKSPPIGSISRTLSWDDTSCSTDTSSSSYPLKPSAEEEEREILSFMDTLLSAAGLQDSPRWHSPDSPLDPSLRDKLASQEVDNEIIAKRRQIRSTRKLLFDCLNVALLDMITSSSTSSACCSSGGPTERVVGQMREWVWRRKEEEEEAAEVAVERVVRKEVAAVGKVWTNEVATVVESLRKEIEGRLLEELVEETVVDFTGGKVMML